MLRSNPYEKRIADKFYQFIKENKRVTVDTLYENFNKTFKELSRLEMKYVLEGDDRFYYYDGFWYLK